MKAAKEIFADGTFEMVKQTMFTQAWVMVVRHPTLGVSIPCAFFLLPDKHTDSYKMVMSTLKELEVLGPDLIHLDFESAVIKAVKFVWPNTNISGCDTHWKRKIRDHQKETGLIGFINKEPVVQHFVRKLWSLVFVPVNQVHDICKEFLEKMPEMLENDSDNENDDAQEYNNAMSNFLNYFEQTWLGQVNKRTGNMGKPKFALDVWNHFDDIQEGSEDITSNRSEAWNSVSKLCIPMNPSIWVVLSSLQGEEGLARAKLAEALSGSPPSDPNPSRTRARVAKYEALRRIVDSWGTVNNDTYIESVAGHFNDL